MAGVQRKAWWGAKPCRKTQPGTSNQCRSSWISNMTWTVLTPDTAYCRLQFALLITLHPKTTRYFKSQILICLFIINFWGSPMMIRIIRQFPLRKVIFGRKSFVCQLQRSFFNPRFWQRQRTSTRVIEADDRVAIGLQSTKYAITFVARNCLCSNLT